MFYKCSMVKDSNDPKDFIVIKIDSSANWSTYTTNEKYTKANPKACVKKEDGEKLIAEFNKFNGGASGGSKTAIIIIVLVVVVLLAAGFFAMKGKKEPAAG